MTKLNDFKLNYEYQESPGELKKLKKLFRQYIKDKKIKRAERWSKKNGNGIALGRSIMGLHFSNSNTIRSNMQYNSKHINRLFKSK